MPPMRYRLRTLLILAALGPPTVWTLYIFCKFDTFDTDSLLIVSLWTVVSALAIGCALDGIGWFLDRKRCDSVRRPLLNLIHDCLRTLVIVLALGPPVLAGAWTIGRQFAQTLLIWPRPAAAYNIVVDSGGGVGPAHNTEIREAITQSRE